MNAGVQWRGSTAFPQGLVADLAELQSGFLSRVAALALGIGFLSAMLARPTSGDVAFWLDMALLVVGIVAMVTAPKHRAVAATLLVIGPLAIWALSLALLGSSQVAFVGLALVLGNFVVGPVSGLCALGGVTAVLLVWAPSSVRWFALGLVWLEAILAWLSLRGFATALTWSQHSQQRSAELLAQLREQRGQLNRTLKALQDTSEHLASVNQELSLARQEAEEARTLKEQFVANVSHELRTPLNLISGFAEIMYLDPDAYEGVRWSPELVGDLGELYRAAKHLQSLVNDILDLSRLDVARLPMFREMLAVGPVVRDAVHTVAPLIRQRGLTLACDLDGEMPLVFADRTRIRQVVINLLNNAVRFTEKGGIRVWMDASDESVVVHIEDTGVGIPEDQLSKLFTRFQQAEAGLRTGAGAGLGLALSREFVELHGGSIWAESTPGQGSVFSFALPLPGAQPISSTLRQTARRTASPDKRPVVLVEQDQGVADMLSRHIEDRQFVRASRMDEVPELVKRWRPQCVVANLPPERPPEDWIACLDDISEQHSVPVIRCSIPSQSWLMLGTTFAGTLGKPVSREMVAQTIAGDNYGMVLIVDDDPGFVSLVSRLLRILGFEGNVLTAYTGEEAIRIGSEEKPDLVLLDLMLPDISGFEVASRLATACADAPPTVIAVTATAYPEESLRRHGSHFTITRSGGISAGRAIELLRCAIATLSPAYEEEVTVASA